MTSMVRMVRIKLERTDRIISRRDFHEVTKIVHGEEEAKKAQTAAKAMFVSGGANEDAPTFEYEADKYSYRVMKYEL